METELKKRSIEEERAYKEGFLAGLDTAKKSILTTDEGFRLLWNMERDGEKE